MESFLGEVRWKTSDPLDPHFPHCLLELSANDITNNLPKEAGLQIDHSQNCATAAAAAVALSLPSPQRIFRVTFYCTTALLSFEQGIENNNLFKTMEGRIKRK